jgi:tRNA A-37 threonylcarbamoyl transferase component Bud32
MQVRCPHCQTPIDLASDGNLSDIACPVCGSSFSLLGSDETLAHEPESKTIGHFDLVEQVGIGTFGTLWKARDKELDRLVAVKIPRKGQLDPEETEQFLREARAAAQLRHENIVSVHEVGREQDTVFIVSDFVEGVTLADRLTAQRFSVREAAELCAKIADALHHAHEAGVIHRDLKPGNIILDAQGEPHIMDFGLARREAGEVTMTVEGRVIGTPAYMSPEQAESAATQRGSAAGSGNDCAEVFGEVGGKAIPDGSGFGRRLAAFPGRQADCRAACHSARTGLALVQKTACSSGNGHGPLLDANDWSCRHKFALVTCGPRGQRGSKASLHFRHECRVCGTAGEQLCSLTPTRRQT